MNLGCNYNIHVNGTINVNKKSHGKKTDSNHIGCYFHVMFWLERHSKCY